MLILGGISGAGMITFLEAYRPLFFVVTFGFLGLAFFFTYRPKAVAAGPSKMMRVNRIMLWCVTGVAVFFLFWPQLLTGLATGDNTLTDDMQRSVITVEGMSCES